MEKHSLRIAGHATSITLEKEFWDQLKKIAAQHNLSVNDLVTRIDAAREGRNLSSAIRVYILKGLTTAP